MSERGIQMRRYLLRTVAKAYPHSASLRTKTTVAIVFASVLCFAVLAVTFAAYDRAVTRAETLDSLRVLAQIIGDNSTAALRFHDHADAQEVLQSLRSESTIRAATIFDGAGNPLARYSRDGVLPEFAGAPPLDDSYAWTSAGAEGFYHVTHDSRRLGTVYLLSDSSQISTLLRQHLMVGLVLLGVCIPLSVLLSLNLQRIIVEPIAQLATVTRRIATDRRYNRRARKSSDDELGQLVDSFNEMLGQIEKQDGELRSAQEELENRVEARTAQLREEVLIRRQAELAMRKLAEELEERNRELVKKNRELDEFTSVASHDLQEPARKVQMFSGYLLEDCGDMLPEDARRDLAVITDAAARMQYLIRDLLAFCRTGKESLEPAKFPIRDAIDSAVEALSERISESEAVIEFDELPEVVGNAVLLTQLYQNLIENGLKFVRDRTPTLRITYAEEDGRKVFGVQDNGIGIKPEYHQRIFAPFRRLHRKEEFEGTGIGLALCKKIVELHQGTMWIESDGETGSHFRFTFWDNEDSGEARLDRTAS